MPGMVSKKDLGAGQIKANETNQKAISDLKAVASSLGRSTTPSSNTDSSRSAYLRQPDQERKKSTSPTPKADWGSEAAERYRPSASPTPGSGLRTQKSFDRTLGKGPSVSPTPSSQHLRSQKSFDRGSVEPGSEDAERYRPSASPTPGSTLRPQKSFERGNSRSYGSEDAEKYRPSASPSPSSTLKTQKSFDRNNNRSIGGGSPASPTPKSSALKTQKSFERSRTLPAPQSTSSYQQALNKSPTLRSASPQKMDNRLPSSAGKPTPTLRSQKSFSDDRSLAPRKTGGRERALSNPKPTTESAASHNIMLPKTPVAVSSYLSSTGNLSTPPTARERTTSTPGVTYLPKDPVAMQATAARSSIYSAVSLARPIQPEPKQPPTAPKIPASAVASPAFQRATTPKDVTPSISRLQGRGFVQNMVKTSLGLEGTSPAPATVSPVPVRPSPGARKGSVLDRWQPQQQQQQTPPPPSPTKSVGFALPSRRETQPTGNRPVSTHAAISSPSTTSSSSTGAFPSYLKTSGAKSSAGSTFDEEPPLTPRTTARMMEKMTSSSAMGSATTAFVEEVSGAAIDDFGVKQRPLSRPSSRGPPSSRSGGGESKSSSGHRASELPAPSGKPLIHVR